MFERKVAHTEAIKKAIDLSRSGTDAYMRHEEKLKMTEGILKLLLKYRFPVFISTTGRKIKHSRAIKTGRIPGRSKCDSNPPLYQ